MTAASFVPWVGFALLWMAVGWICGAACRD
ncbi:hypothetical protein J2126_000661 [Xanthobacter flavus]|nr:hypothetical protein [Xanthobacter flavus]